MCLVVFGLSDCFLSVFQLICFWFLLVSLLVLLGCFRWCWLFGFFVLFSRCVRMLKLVLVCGSLWLFVFLCFRLLWFFEFVQIGSSCLSFLFESIL